MDSGNINDSSNEQNENTTQTSEGTPSSTPFPQSPPRTPPSSGDEVSQRESPPSPFQPPPYILKNLTPVKKTKTKRDYSEHHNRRAQYLSNKQELLKHRALKINQKINEVKAQRYQEVQSQIENLNNNLKMVNSRRQQYLRFVSERAGSFLNKQLPRRKSLVSSRQLPLQPKRNTRLSTSKPLVLEKRFDSTNLQVLQRMLKSALYDRNLKILNDSRFLHRFTLFNSDYSFAEGVRSLSRSSAIKNALVYILKYFDVPDPLMTSEPYSGFLYAFILIADYHDCVNDGSIHPGFNCNLENNEHENCLNNFIWLLVYKHANEMIDNFKQVLKVGYATTAFLESWQNYAFLLAILKRRHFGNIKLILQQSIDLTAELIELLGDDEAGVNRKSKLELEKQLLEKYPSFRAQDIFESPESTNFLTTVNLELHQILGNPASTRSYPRIYSTSRVVRYQNSWFSIPMVSSMRESEWRKYWFKKFSRGNHDRMFPESIRSGHVSTKTKYAKSREMLDVEDILTEVKGKSQESHIERCKSHLHMGLKMKTIYDELFQYYKSYSETYLDNYDPDNIERILDSLFNEDGKELSKHYFTLIDNLLEKPISGSSIVRFPSNWRELLDNEDKFEELADLIQEFEKSVANLWINECKIDSFEMFKRFENVVCLVKAPNFGKLKSSFFTNSPNLLFPKFYAFLKRLTNANMNDLVNMSTLHACMETPRVYGNEHNESAKKYFSSIYSDLITRKDTHYFEENELNKVYLFDLLKIHRMVIKLVGGNTGLMLVSSFYSTLTIDNIAVIAKFQPIAAFNDIYEVASNPDRLLQTLQEKLPKWFGRSIQDLNFDSFKAYFLRNHDRIFSLLVQKFTTLCKMQADTVTSQQILQGNFRFCQQHTEAIVHEISALTAYIYKVYGPLLNWIYKDLGSPGS
ncbi:uncharacterized protein RJT20DRAFT_13789 [Scheffersomyces xylosifermentans]|uniref:uncharacterized protein n=1 Tax=Scheffersomyces xylosifermentans TaxID=1304137 RepID=UPI00315D1DC4